MVAGRTKKVAVRLASQTVTPIEADWLNPEFNTVAQIVPPEWNSLSPDCACTVRSNSILLARSSPCVETTVVSMSMPRFHIVTLPRFS